MKMYEKWMKLLPQYISGKSVSCPVCGKNNLEDGYVMLDKRTRVGYGAVWCNDCKHAFNVSRAVLKSDEKVLSELPRNLIYG